MRVPGEPDGEMEGLEGAVKVEAEVLRACFGGVWVF